MFRLAPRPGLAAGALLAVAFGGIPPGLASCSGEVPVRIVLITIDTLRYDSFAGRAGRAASMPHTQAYAERGQVFEAFYAATPATQPTHATLFTGLHPWRHGVSRNGLVLGEELSTLAERLHAAGFATAAVVASFPLHRRFGFAQGFDSYAEVFELPVGALQWEGAAIEGGAFYALADSVTDRALERLDAARGSRQFFWIHYFDPHSPSGDRRRQRLTLPDLKRVSQEHPAQASRWIQRARALYEADVVDLDRSLARLFERLERDGDAVATHVIFTADHGESFGEDGTLGHGERVSEDQVHVPFFVVSPRWAPARRRDTAGSADVAATVLALAGLDPGAVPGRDLGAAADAGAGSAFGMRPPARWAGEERAPRFFAVVDATLWAGDAKAVARGDLAGAPAPPAQLEGELRALFAAFESELAGASAQEDVSEETRHALEALGYTR